MEAVVAVLIVALIIVAAAAAWFFWQMRRSQQLRRQFGPEYERTVQEIGDRRRAERELEARRERVENFRLKPLSEIDRARFADAWQKVQAYFVDDPPAAIAQADALITEVMQARGYPAGDFESRAADLSVNYPDVVINYRAAHQIALASGRGQAGTEQIRQAMVHYRALFAELLETAQPERTEVRR